MNVSTKHIIFIIGLLTSTPVWSQNNKPDLCDSIDVSTTESGDSIVFSIVSKKIETQLTFLMQGLCLRIEQPDTISLTFPSAQLVRHKMRHHPNEVKASFAERDSIHKIVRPDVQPLIAALNDTTAIISYSNKHLETHNFHINVDRNDAVMMFRIGVNKQLIVNADNNISVTLISCPFTKNGRSEFNGNRLSQENAPQPNGLGGGIRKEDISSRTIERTFKTEIITNKNKE